MENVKKTKAKQAFCPHCKYSTDRKNNLKRHIVTMHQDSSKILECCDTVFKSKALLREHVLLNHRSGYVCKICKRSFCRKALLRRHLSVHNGQKDFRCPFCSYATSHKSNLERHRKIHSKEDTVSEYTEGKGFSELEIPYGHSKEENTSKERNHGHLANKIHTAIVAKYENLLQGYDKCPIEQVENKNLENSRETFHDDNMNQVQIDPRQTENNRRKQFCIPPTSVKRLLDKPYKCSLCNRQFTSQNQEQRHDCVLLKDDFPNVPIICMIRKGIPPQQKYHL